MEILNVKVTKRTQKKILRFTGWSILIVTYIIAICSICFLWIKDINDYIPKQLKAIYGTDGLLVLVVIGIIIIPLLVAYIVYRCCRTCMRNCRREDERSTRFVINESRLGLL